MNVAVMIHGAGGGGWEWELWRTKFEASGWTVVTPDLMPAERGLEHTHFGDYVVQARDSIPNPVPSRLVLIGASMGGLIALKLLEQQEAQAVILVNSVPPKAVNWKPQRLYPPIVKWANRPVQESIAAMTDCSVQAAEEAAAKWKDESGSLLNEIGFGIEVNSPRCPVLVISGGRDTDVPPEVSVKLAEWASGQFISFSEMGHLGPLLGPDAGRVAAAAIFWLKSSALL